MVSKKAVSGILSGILILTLVFCVAFAPSPKVEVAQAAENLDDLQEKYNLLEKEQSDLEEQLKSIQQKKNDRIQYIEVLNEKINSYNLQLDLICGQMDSLNRELSELQSKIDALQVSITNIEGEIEVAKTDIILQNNKITETYELFEKRLRAMYISGDTSNLEILLTSPDFSDFLTRIELVKGVAEQDVELLEDLEVALKELEESKAKLEAQKEELRLNKLALESDKSALEGKKKEFEVIKADFEEKQRLLKADRAELESALQDLSAKEQSYLQAIGDHESEIDKIDEEIKQVIRENEEKKALKRAEEQAKAAAAKNNSNRADGVGGDSGDSSDSGQSQNSGGQSQTPVSNAETNNGSGSGKMLWPIQGRTTRISSYYGPRWGRVHRGLDITGANIYGATISAAESGTVILAQYGHSSYGHYVIIDHGGGIATLYAHCSQLLVSAGQTVSRGDAIAKVGNTGNSTGPHLHFEVRVGGERINPLPYL